MRQDFGFKLHAACLAVMAQGRASLRPIPTDPGANRCLYRGPDGTKCIVGHIMPDDKYHEDLEDKGVFESVVQEAAFGYTLEEDELVLAKQLQSAHDMAGNNYPNGGPSFVQAFGYAVHTIWAGINGVPCPTRFDTRAKLWVTNGGL